nr:hypothetical protein [Tanacetum cinerariifolium]
ASHNGFAVGYSVRLPAIIGSMSCMSHENTIKSSCSHVSIVLSIKDKLNYLEQPIPPTLVAPTGQQVAPEILAAYNAWIKGSKEAERRQSVSLYVLKMKGYIENLERLGHPVTLGLGVSLILIGLRKECNGFVKNYNMHNMGKTVNELHAMLKLYEQILPKNNAPALNVIRASKVQKSELLKKKKNAASRAGGSENQLGKTIKSLRSDRGGEYMSQEFLDHLKDHGIIAHRTPPYTPQYNGVSERRNRTLIDIVRSMMSQTTLPKSFWDYALETAARILNMVLTKKEMMGDSFYYPPENKVLVAQNAKFLDNGLINQEASGSLEDLKIIQEEDTHPSIDTSLNHEEDDLEIDEPQRDLGEPANYKAALLDPESKKWLNAMNMEMQSMKDNEVWILVELPPNGKIVGSKWLFKKRLTWMEIHRAIRILIAIAAYHDYKIWQMDVKTAFLNGYLNADVYMEQPKGNNIPTLQSVKSYLGRCFAMKDLGEAAYILGIKIYIDRSRRLIGLCQSAYIEKILKRYCMENSKCESIPMHEKLKLSKSQGASTHVELKHMQNVPYASAVGSIMYAVRYPRPDVAFAQNTGYVFILNGGVVNWKSAKQSIFATSSAKAEYIAAFDASKEAVWVRKFISGLGVVPTIKEPISMYCYNTEAISIANES